MTPPADMPVSGWKEFELGELLTLSNGINAARSAYGQGMPFANVLEVITNESIAESDIPGRMTVTRKLARRYRVRHGDVLFNRTSETQDEVGLSSVYLGDAPIVFGGFVFRGGPLTDNVTQSYSKYAFRTPFVRRQIIARGQGGIRANIGQRDLKSVRVHLPPPAEQEAIAAVLDHISCVISSLEALLVKKHAMKQGVMQELLTGKTRLPGFSEPWTSLHVASASELKARIGWQGLTTAEYRTSGFYRLVGGTEFVNGSIDWGSTPFVDKWRYDQDTGIQLRQGDILLTKDGSIGKTAYVDKLPSPATLNSGVFVIRPRHSAYCSRFLYFMLLSRVFSDFLRRLSAGSTISHLYQRDLVGLKLRVPRSVDEQRAIAEVLGDLDDDLKACVRRLAKARDVKQGMMQQLLTGRTRLPITEPAG